MKIRVERKKFIEAIKKMEKAISENKIREALSGMMLDATGNTLKIYGTDLEFSIESEIEAEIQEKGQAVVSPKMLLEFISQISDENIDLEESESMLKVISDSIEAKFGLYDKDNYVIPDFPELAGRYDVNREEFIADLTKVLKSASDNPENLAVNCVRIILNKSELEYVSTDTYRMTYLKKRTDGAEDGNYEVSIPFKSVERLAKILSSEKEEIITLNLDSSKMVLLSGNTKIMSRLIELPFPDFRTILANERYNKHIVLNTAEFAKMLKRVKLFTRNNKSAKYGAIFEFEGKTLKVIGDDGNAKISEKVPVIQEGENVKLSLNVEYLLDFVSTVPGETLAMEIVSGREMIKIHPENDESYKAMIMPLALRN